MDSYRVEIISVHYFTRLAGNADETDSVSSSFLLLKKESTRLWFSSEALEPTPPRVRFKLVRCSLEFTAWIFRVASRCEGSAAGSVEGFAEVGSVAGAGHGVI